MVTVLVNVDDSDHVNVMAIVISVPVFHKEVLDIGATHTTLIEKHVPRFTSIPERHIQNQFPNRLRRVL